MKSWLKLDRNLLINSGQPNSFGYSVIQCQQTIASLFSFTGWRFEALPLLFAAYKAWHKHGGDWADHLIGAQMKAMGCDTVMTLDKAAGKAGTHNWFEDIDKRYEINSFLRTFSLV